MREAAARLQCQNNLKQIGLACHSYHDANQGLPPGYLATASYVDGTTDVAPGWGWAAFLLPYLEQDNLYRQLSLNQPIQNSAAIQTVVKAYLCPMDSPPPSPFALTGPTGATVTHGGAVQLRRDVRPRRLGRRRPDRPGASSTATAARGSPTSPTAPARR